MDLSEIVTFGKYSVAPRWYSGFVARIVFVCTIIVLVGRQECYHSLSVKGKRLAVHHLQVQLEYC